MDVTTVSQFERDVLRGSSPHAAVFVVSGQVPAAVEVSALIPSLEKDYQNIKFFIIDAATLTTNAEFLKAVGVSTVPTVAMYNGGVRVALVTGFNPPAIIDALQNLADGKLVPEDPAEAKKRLFERLDKLVNAQPVMLFMKGSRDEPFCRFSRQMVQLLKDAGVTEFGHFDIFQDEAVRQGLKEYGQWPTFPQLYSGGQLVGGVDVVKEILESGGPEALRQELESLQKEKESKK